uniref:Flavanone 4-reductase n=1 Tax=Nelumbo lutea TaxID=4431 RepID=A0A1L2BPG8_NELLU|nr:dihydroflavonol 4-reductase 1 [Nelumbo lutea]
MVAERGTVCVTGAAGFVGSWLVMRLLEEGYTVRATVRDPGNLKKVKHLLDLPKASTHLTLWKADLVDDGSFDEAIQGCSGVFHVATPMDFESKDPENEVIKPCIEGVLNIMRSCAKAKTVRRVVFTSSAGTVNVQEHQQPEYDESSWSDVDFCRRTKMTGWMYFVSKSLAEKAAWEFAEENNIDFISIIPTLVVGPFIMSSMPPSMITALALITGTESHYSILKQVQFVHLDDLCNAHIYLFEHPEAKGRYICSSDQATIYSLANMLKEKFPEYNIPTKFEGIDESLEAVRFSSEKIRSLGFEFKYSVGDMYVGAVKCAREKGLIPLSTAVEPPVNENAKDVLVQGETQAIEIIN